MRVRVAGRTWALIEALVVLAHDGTAVAPAISVSVRVKLRVLGKG